MKNHQLSPHQKGTIMPKSHTDSYVVTHHDDGSWTEEQVTTHYPLTRGQKAAAWGAVGAALVLPAVPLLFVIGVEKAEELWTARKDKKQAKKAESETN